MNESSKVDSEIQALRERLSRLSAAVLCVNAPTYANRRRIRSNRGRPLFRQGGEKVERAVTHLLETSGLRRVHALDNPEILKRMNLQGAAFIGVFMRTYRGVRKPRVLQGNRSVQLALAGA